MNSVLWTVTSLSLLCLVSPDSLLDASTSVNGTAALAVTGRQARLPCDISIPGSTDRVSLILWFKENEGKPIYSIEVPEDGSFSKMSSSSFWSSSAHFGTRASFSWDTMPATLDVQNIKAEEGGVYRCRVDFKESQTRNNFVNLTVIVPPDPVLIFDEEGRERMTFVGPYTEGQDAKLTCTAYAGVPPPRVVWLQDGTIIDSTFKVSQDQKEVSNQIILHRLNRENLHDELTCSVWNTNLTRSILHSLQLDMNFAPADIRIQPEESDMLVGNKYRITCKSSGSRPPPVITWFLDDIRLEGSIETFSSDGNTTESNLNILPTIQHNQRTISCQANNPSISHPTIQAQTVLNILYPPNVELRLGRSISSNSIYEGGDVYFDCRVDSNPPPSTIRWFLNGYEIIQNVEEGVIFTNQSLVLQRISRNQTGEYLCEASNQVGKGRSQLVFLDVKYAPVCNSVQPRIYGVTKREEVNVYCSVQANPAEVEFKWTFNNSAEMIRVPEGRTIDNKSLSVLSYTPLNTMDFGTIMCTATNAVGRQNKPCIFHIILAVTPDSVENCSIINKSSESFHLSCLAGFDGGLNQTFDVEVEDNLTGKKMYEKEGLLVPVVKVENLQPGAPYRVTITSRNKKGYSEPREILVETLQPPEIQKIERKREGSGFQLPWEIIAGAGSGCAVVVLLIVVVVVGLRRRRGAAPLLPQEENSTANSSTKGESRVHGSPDLIPRSESECWEFGIHPGPSERLPYSSPRTELGTFSNFSRQDEGGRLLLDAGEDEDGGRRGPLDLTLRAREFEADRFVAMAEGSSSPTFVSDPRDLIGSKSRTIAFMKEKRESIV